MKHRLRSKNTKIQKQRIQRYKSNNFEGQKSIRKSKIQQIGNSNITQSIVQMYLIFDIQHKYRGKFFKNLSQNYLNAVYNISK